jgi:hypothetical protein
MGTISGSMPGHHSSRNRSYVVPKTKRTIFLKEHSLLMMLLIELSYKAQGMNRHAIKVSQHGRFDHCWSEVVLSSLPEFQQRQKEDDNSEKADLYKLGQTFCGLLSSKSIEQQRGMCKHCFE